MDFLYTKFGGANLGEGESRLLSDNEKDTMGNLNDRLTAYLDWTRWGPGAGKQYLNMNQSAV